MSPLQVLLVDDNPDDRLMARRAIDREFPEARYTEPIDRAEFDAALLRPHDVVVTDYRLGWSDGLEVLRAVKARDAAVPVIMVTSTGNEDICAEGLRLGLSDYLVKRRDQYLRLPRAIAASIALAQQSVARERHRRELEANQHRLAKLLESERLAHESSERARAEAQAANRVKDQFLSTLSHELRTPLSAVLGWAHVLQRKTDDPLAVQRGLDVIVRNAKMQVALIEDLLDMSRIVSGRLQLERETIDLAEPVRSAVETALLACEAAGLALDLHIEPDVGLVRADPLRVQQIVANLLSNAIKFTPAGGRIGVRLRRSGRYAELAVQDTGIGIATSMLPHVFDGFRQADNTIRRSHRGLGIGLTIVKTLSELHGGHVAARSAGPGQGAEFTVCLPLEDASARPVAAVLPRPVQQDRSLEGVSVLLVEDDVDTRDVLVEMLASAGAKVATASDMDTGLRLLQETRPRVLLSDIGLPRHDGYQLIAAVRALSDGALARVPAVALTAFGRTQDRERAALAGFDMHLTKPVEPGELVAVVRRLATVPV